MANNDTENSAALLDHDCGVLSRGGSWFDMPEDATSATRWGYNENIRLPNLGFRIIIED